MMAFDGSGQRLFGKILVMGVLEKEVWASCRARTVRGERKIRRKLASKLQNIKLSKCSSSSTGFGGNYSRWRQIVAPVDTRTGGGGSPLLLLVRPSPVKTQLISANQAGPDGPVILSIVINKVEDYTNILNFILIIMVYETNFKGY